MPTIHRLGVIKIQVFGADHPPLHFHVAHPDGRVLVGIETLEVIAGRLAERHLREALAWAGDNHELLRRAWRELNEERRR